jgi:hypothetical protein
MTASVYTTIAGLLEGHPAAASFCRDLLDVLDVWDDLVDRDKPVCDEQINHAFQTAIFRFAANPFYQQHQLSLLPIMNAAAINWEVATTLERGGQVSDLNIAFILRSSYVDVLVACVGLTCGPQAALAAALLLRSAAHSEGLAQYVENLQAERRERGD